MNTTQILIIVAAVAVALLLIIIALRLSRRRKVNAMSPEQRDLHYAQQAHKKRVAELKSDFKSVEKDTGRAVKDAKSRLDGALAIGSERIDSVKGPAGTVSLTSLELTTPGGTRAVTPQLRATAEATGAAPVAEGDDDTRRMSLTIEDGEHRETIDFKADQEAAVRGLAARITSAGEHVEEVTRQRDEATREAEQAVATANEQATVRLNDAQVRYDKGIAASEAKVRDAETRLRESRVR